ncbi:MAG TPA: V-type ATP synthase subunit D [Candidatus Onthenecus intestinigallinarum]|uniref:V-type ATP synthase subunit D n=1 Tax=Candidatus Onthenecus intestinigallinarum TaxID=2840875 RepID=A0A9D0Z848_9FIRM|nr:V-type ATP synthase subunit D [Candidatus Onthenecus intestinigallinarum]
MAAALHVNPTRMELTRIKRRLVTARRGHKLLKDKRDEMVRQFILLVRENAKLRKEVERELKGALADFALARAVMDNQTLEEAILYPARSAGIVLGERNVLSVHVPTITVVQNSEKDSALPYGLAETSADLDDAIATMARLLPKLLRLAETEKTCDLLADEIEKTRRRVNALEYVMIPQFEETIRFISMKLDENERGSLTRLMKVKDMIAERQA